MHSSQGSGHLPKVHQRHEGLGADPQDQPAELTLQPSNSAPRPEQLSLCGDDTMGVNWLPFSRQEGLRLKEASMNRHKIAAVLSALLLVCCGALILGQKVNAAGEGKITGTVKLAAPLRT